MHVHSLRVREIYKIGRKKGVSWVMFTNFEKDMTDKLGNKNAKWVYRVYLTQGHPQTFFIGVCRVKNCWQATYVLTIKWSKINKCKKVGLGYFYRPENFQLFGWFQLFLLLKFTHFLLFSAQFELFYFDFKPFFSFLSIFSVFDKRSFSGLFLAVLHVYHT